MTAPDHRASPSDDARSRFYAWRTTMGDSAQDVSQQDVFYEAFSQGVRWCFRTTSALAPWMDTLSRLMEYLAAPTERCPNCGEKL